MKKNVSQMKEETDSREPGSNGVRTVEASQTETKQNREEKGRYSLYYAAAWTNARKFSHQIPRPRRHAGRAVKSEEPATGTTGRLRAFARSLVYVVSRYGVFRDYSDSLVYVVGV